MTTIPSGTEQTTDELVLEPPTPVPTVTPEQAAATVRVDEATASRISAAVNAYVDSLVALEAQSPEFEQKVAAISRMGNEEMRRSAEASSRFLDRPTIALQQGPMAQGSQVGDYFRKYQSAQSQIEAIVSGLYRGQDELLRDNAALEQEKAHLWEVKRRQ